MWGVQAVQQLHMALENRRYDWRWLAGSLQLSLKGQCDALLPANSPAFGLVPEPTPSNLAGVLTAARQKFLTTQRACLSRSRSPVPAGMVTPNEKDEINEIIDAELYHSALDEVIKQKGEPIDYEEVIYTCRIVHALGEELPQNLLELERGPVR